MPSIIDFGLMGEKNSAFVGLFVRNSYPLKNYEGVSEKQRQQSCSRVILINRWDFTIGFPGGFVEKGESLVDAAVRETLEETGLRINPDRLKPVVSHAFSTDLNVHFFSYEITEEQMVSVLESAPKARDFIAESFGIMSVMLINRKDKGFSEWVEQAPFAATAKFELLELVRTEKLL